MDSGASLFLGGGDPFDDLVLATAFFVSDHDLSLLFDDFDLNFIRRKPA